ncbi:G5 domain-containing protein [Cohnella sp. OV330]|uniref:VanW family protein n=1 Tax=Cohnella sp. OV330 TaxID=1855288 RepID=UPI0008E99163|nr:VanW family protein [Cohnella sp. OV330]SFB48182.1 G5 domain-containing protein [Cohnella sp. OV330]
MDKRIVRIAAAFLAMIGVSAGAAVTGHAGAAGSTNGYMQPLDFSVGDARIAIVESAFRRADADDVAVKETAKHAERRPRALPDGVAAGSLDLSGLSADAAIAKVQARIEAALDGRVRLVTGRVEALEERPTWRELGLQLNAEEALRAIERYRDAGWLKRRSAGRAIAKRFSIETVWDEETFAEKAEAMWGPLAEKQPVDAVRTIDAYDQVVYSPETPGETLDISRLLAAFKNYAPKSLNEAPPSAGEPLSIELRVPVIQVTPEITQASLQAQGIARKIAEFSTSFAASGEGRVHNVEATADALDGTMLMPGETFDYGAVVAEARRVYGYREAPVILKGKLVPGIGGGICQVSSTLYNAVLRASDLKIVERHNHSLPVNYLPQGMDATFAEGYINFRFRNDTGKRLLIKAAVRDKRLTVKLFGTMADNVRYELETVRVKDLLPRTVYRQDADVPVGMSRLLQAGKSGAVVDTYRLKYVDGQLHVRSKLNRSTYRAQDTIVAVHPADSRAGRSEQPQPSPQGRTPAEPM